MQAIQANRTIFTKVGTMSNNDNTDILNIPVIKDVRDFAEAMRQMHSSVAFSSNNAVAAYDAMPYKTTKAALLVAIGTAYPDVDIQAIYDIWVDCNESIAYCVNWYKKDQKEIRDTAVEFVFQDITDMEGDLRSEYIRRNSDSQDNRDKSLEALRSATPGNSDMRNAMRKPYNS